MSPSEKRSHLNSCDLNVNVHDVEIQVCKSQTVFGIIMSEVLGCAEQITDVAKRLNHSLFFLQKSQEFLLLKARIAYCNTIL